MGKATKLMETKATTLGEISEQLKQLKSSMAERALREGVAEGHIVCAGRGEQIQEVQVMRSLGGAML